MGIKYCNTCLLSDKDKKICQLNGMPINLGTDFCSKHKEEFILCEICRQPLIVPGIVEVDADGKPHEFCKNCNAILKTCQACPKYTVCAFNTDPDPMPKMVIQTIQQGNMTMQTQIKNPERIAKFCHSCECWNEYCECMKEFNIGCQKKPDFWTGRSPS